MQPLSWRIVFAVYGSLLQCHMQPNLCHGKLLPTRQLCDDALPRRKLLPFKRNVSAVPLLSRNLLPVQQQGTDALSNGQLLPQQRYVLI